MQKNPVKVDMQVKIMIFKINKFTHHFHGPIGVYLIDLHIWNNTTGTTAENLKFYSKGAVSICCPPLHIKIDHLLVKLAIDGPFVRAITWRCVVSKVNYLDKLHWLTFSNRKKEPIKHIKIIHFITTQISYKQPSENVLLLFFFKKFGIHSMQGWTATMRHGVKRKRSTKRLKHTGNLFRINLWLIDVC